MTNIEYKIKFEYQFRYCCVVYIPSHKLLHYITTVDYLYNSTRLGRLGRGSVSFFAQSLINKKFNNEDKNGPGQGRSYDIMNYHNELFFNFI